MMPLKSSNYLLFLIMLFATVSTPKSWEQVKGPAGGQASAIIQCGGILFAGSSTGGIFRSDDKGGSWYHLDSSYSLAITALASKGDTLIAGTRYSGVFLSPDSGVTWVNVYSSDDPLDRNINSIRVMDEAIYFCTKMNMLRSSDNGRTWVKINEQSGFPVFYYCKDFAEAGGYYFACSSQNYGIIKSNDKGSTWHTANTGLFDSSVYSLVAIDSVLFAGTYRNNVFRSTDYGITWEHCSNGLPPDSSSCNFLYTDGTRLFASIGKSGLCVSRNYGKSWEVLTSTKSFDPKITGMVKVSDNRYVGTGVCAGIYRIFLDSMIVTPGNNGFYGRNILSLSSDSTTLLASTYYYTTSLSRNNGDTWTDILEIEYVNAYACLVKGNSVYIGTRGDGIFQKKSSIPDGPEKQSVEIDRDTYLDVKAFAAIGRYTLVCGGDKVVCRKEDGESTWKKCSNGITPEDYFTDICENKGRLFLAGFDFYISDDSATTWNMKIPRGSGRFNTIAASEHNVYTSGNLNGVYWSSDNGKTWNEPVGELPYVVALATWNMAVIAGTKGGGIFISLDNAKTWKSVNEGLFNYSILSLTVQNNTLYAGTEGNGIFKMDLEQWLALHTSFSATSTHAANSVTISQTGNFISIIGKNKLHSIECYDLLGRNSIKRIYQQNNGTNSLRLNIKKMDSRIVLLRVHTKGETEIKPVIICK